MTAAQGQIDKQASLEKLLVILSEGMSESFGGSHTGRNTQRGSDSSLSSLVKPHHRTPSSHKGIWQTAVRAIAGGAWDAVMPCGVLCLSSLVPFSFFHRLPRYLSEYQYSLRPGLYFFEAFPDCCRWS